MKPLCEACRKEEIIKSPTIALRIGNDKKEYHLCSKCTEKVNNQIVMMITPKAEVIIEEISDSLLEEEEEPEIKGCKPSGKSKYAYIVTACPKYIPELCACLNSLDYVGNKQDVYVLGYKLPKYFIDQFDKLNYNVNFYDIPEHEARQYGGESEIVCRKRFWYAAGYGEDHEAVCVLDADMFFCQNVDPYFNITAKTGYILGAGLEQKRMYGHIEHHKVRGKHLLPEPVWNAKDICCAPLFFDAHKYGDLFKECWTIFADGYPEDNFKAPDMESYNLLILAKKLSDQVILLTNYSWVGTNEKLLKPYIRCVSQQDGNLYTEGGDTIYVVHGKYYSQVWRTQQILNRHGCAIGVFGEGCSEKCDNLAKGAMELLYNRFKKMLDWKIVIEKNAYTNDGDPGNSVFGELNF